MKFTIGKKLTFSFLGLAGLVLLAGGVGIFILNKVSNSADMVAKEKAPAQNAVMNGVVDLEIVQKTIAEYINTSTGLEALEERYASKLDEYDMWLAMLQLGSDSEKFQKSKSGKLYKKLKINTNVPKGSEKTQLILNKVLKESVVFKKNTIDLIQAQKDYLSYSVTNDNKNYPLPVYLSLANREHDEWLAGLNDAVIIITPFKGNMDPKKGLVGKWLSEYNVDNKKVMKLVKKLYKRHKKMMAAAVKINSEKTYEGKLKYFNRNSASAGMMTNYFNAMRLLSESLYKGLDSSKEEKFNAMTISAKSINQALDKLRKNAEMEMVAALEQAEKAETQGVTILIILTLIAVIIAIVLGVVMSRYFSGKIYAMAEITKKVSSGDLKNKIDVTSKDEFGDLANDTNAMI
ncbi:MAG: methyl-accepting chemotaxis protein, partial [Desulfobacteraceae bacterium]|nr:methyl-accepting chemotaxis protein [Desulfobacteraceae bacterium]